MNKLSYYCMLLFLSLLISCGGEVNDKTLRIAAASNLRFVLEEINILFEEETGYELDMISASSGKLSSQITNGAPYDVFLSANKKYPFSLYKDSLTSGEPKLFCEGILVLWTNKEIELDTSLKFLLHPNIVTIAMANPQNAPYGIASMELLKQKNLFDSIQSKLIFAENISQLSQYVLNNAVDLGFTSKSMVVSPKMDKTGLWIELNPKLYNPILQYITLLKMNKEKAAIAQRYLEFILSDKTQKVFQKFGYKTL